MALSGISWTAVGRLIIPRSWVRYPPAPHISSWDDSPFPAVRSDVHPKVRCRGSPMRSLRTSGGCAGELVSFTSTSTTCVSHDRRELMTPTGGFASKASSNSRASNARPPRSNTTGSPGTGGKCFWLEHSSAMPVSSEIPSKKLAVRQSESVSATTLYGELVSLRKHQESGRELSPDFTSGRPAYRAPRGPRTSPTMKEKP